MKQILILLTICIGSCLFTTSCTDNDNIDNNVSSKPVEPGIYYVGMKLNATREATTKGVDANINFDTFYDYTYIYLHKKNEGGTEETIQFPVWKCDECAENEVGIRYRICIQEDGSAIITPIKSDGEHDNTQQMTLTENDECYFSSWPTAEWQLGDEQISAETVGNEDYHFFYRNQENNKEIYRSEDNYSIADLQSDGDLSIVRACAGFNLLGLFYDSSNPVDKFGQSGKRYPMSETIFEDIMKSSPDEWYIKIYIGGDSYPNQYNIESETSTSSQNGYYSSGDGSKFSEEDIDTQQYLPFSQREYGQGENSYEAYGYYTKGKDENTGEIGNHLFTPVTGEEVNVYILVKHWTGEDDPTEEWLNSDIGALQTKVSLTGNTTPENNYFYTMGLLMDIQQFKAAWDASGGDNWTPESASAISTKSPSGATVREFTLKDAIVICDVY